MAEFFVLLLLAQFTFGFFTLVRLDNGLCGHDVRLFFLVIFALYSLFYPIVAIVLDFSVITGSSFLQMLICYNLAIFAFNWILVMNQRPLTNACIYYNEVVHLPSLIYVFISLLCFSVFFMVIRGVPVFHFGEGMMDRTEYGENVNQIWVILAFVITGVTCFLIYNWELMSKQQKRIVGSFILFYIVYQTSLGNRNEFSAIIIFILGYYLIKRGKSLNLKLIIGLFFLFVFSFYITIYRDPNVRDLARSEAVEIALQSNEFVYPMQTLYYTIEDDWNFRYGYTYFILPFETLIPRSLYQDKTPTLGAEFVEETFGPGSMGYAYTPVTEAYLNFGYLGPFVVFLLFSLFLDRLVADANERGISFKYLMVYALSFNINRGEFASIMYMSLFLYLAYKFSMRICVQSFEEESSESM